jgi:hypothetical protein
VREDEKNCEIIIDKIIQTIIKSENKFKLKKVIDIYNLLEINNNNKKKKKKKKKFFKKNLKFMLKKFFFY